VTGAGPCITAGAISVLAASISAGIYTAGASEGWVFESAGAGAGEERRSTNTPFENNRMGLTHNYDSTTHQMLNQTYGNLLRSHNTTIITVTWLEQQPSFNHTGKVTEHLNMTLGRLVSLKDHGTGYIHTGLGQIEDMGRLIEAFGSYKTSQATGSSKRLGRRQSEVDVSFMSYTTYGENMQEGSEYFLDIEDDSISEGEGPEDDVFTFDTGGIPEKFCLSAGPPNEDEIGYNSIIVGEVYMNQWGGLDGECQSG
jgi:hypothetical protein